MDIDQIITDPTDCDVYKFSMGNFLYKQGYLREKVGWKFFNRARLKFPIGYSHELQKQINRWADLSFSDNMLKHLEQTMYWLDYYYIWAYLKTYKFDSSCISIRCEVKIAANGDKYEDVSVEYEGEWGKVIFYEIFLLSTMSELYNIMTNMDSKILPPDEQRLRLREKLVGLNGCGAKVAEFGTRRRYSKKIHRVVLEQMKLEAPKVLQGTSNAMFSREMNLTPIGTLGHELVMYMGAKYGPTVANEILMNKWVDVYNGALGIYLPDTYTTKHFLKYFDLKHSKLWDGVREDSAPDTDLYVDMMIDHYKKLRIDPSTKTINHSNAISNLEKIVHMQNYRRDEIKRNFGLGTWLTNDVYPLGSGLKAVDWVIKMTHIYQDGHKKYCVKLSDATSKVTSVDDETVKRYMMDLNLI